MSGKIFISYRRGDEPGFTQALFGRLEQAFPAGRIFIDVDSITPGQDFALVLESQVAQCDTLLAVIGKGWLDARDERGNRRLDDPNDFVRFEIESAIKQGKRVIPVLVHDAQMPRRDDLPEALRPLAGRHAVRLTHERFGAETQALVKALQQAPAEVADLRGEEQRAQDDLHVGLPDAAGTAEQGAEAQGPWWRSRRALLTGCVIGIALVGSIGVWLANPYPPPIAPEPTPAQAPAPVPPEATPAPAPVPPEATPEHAPAPPVQPPTSGQPAPNDEVQPSPQRRRRMAVAVVGPAGDLRWQAVDAAISFWNRTLEEIGSGLRFGPVTRTGQPVPEQAVLWLGTGGGTGGKGDIPQALRNLPADVTIFLAGSEFVSFARHTDTSSKWVVGIRGTIYPPMNLSNVPRNVIAHELGHAIGLAHNSDPEALMCGRPASCQPFRFASPRARMFPLIDYEKRGLVVTYPP